MIEKVIQKPRAFDFGKNWASYAQTITDMSIEQARKDLFRLLGGHDLSGRRFLDIGCGSGLHALAALRLGALEVVGIDIDPVSVQTAQQVLRTHAAASTSWRFEVNSVFDFNEDRLGRFDVVYAWGVLHHTGDMRRAIRHAIGFVANDGEFLIALYRKTGLCRFWRIERRVYSQSPKWVQTTIRTLYMLAYRCGLRVLGTSLDVQRNDFCNMRGMDLDHDVHDWLGGYPYESISPAELVYFMESFGFEAMRKFEPISGPFGRLGIFGSGCFEHAYKKNKTTAVSSNPQTESAP